MTTTKHPLYIAFVWHMHQPYYKDITDNKYILPWVRLHGIKDYYGMANLVSDIKDAHVTFSLTPSLLEQIQDYDRENLIQDEFIELTKKPAEKLTPDERVFILKNFFLANWETMVKIYPRYDELLQKRGYFFSNEELDIKQGFFSVQEMRDIQLWHNLTWTDTWFQRNDERAAKLIARNKGFDHSDIDTLIGVQKEIISKIIQTYKTLMEKGVIELITAPFYHPILPLLYDMSLAKVAAPDIRLPEMLLKSPQDCRIQLNMAVNYHKSLFGRKPKGIWPSEGSVFHNLVPILQESGLEWTATDEAILAQSLNIILERDLHGCLKEPSKLYKPYWVVNGDRRIICVFRDHVLSDLIGFVYYKWDIERAVDDFHKRLKMIRQKTSNLNRPAIVTIIMDGENAWEFYPHNGRDFLSRLYEVITRDEELKMVTISEFLEEFPPTETDRIEKLFPGSWINHDLKVWIGHEEENRAWEHLLNARQAIEENGDISKERLELAKKELYIAEGSDWFWWYGDDHFTEHADLFDYLFRKHLMNIYYYLGLDTPNELHIPIIINRVKSEFKCEPKGFISPSIDGRINNYFEWLSSVRFRVKQSGGTIHRAESILKDIYYGFSIETLYIRLDTSHPLNYIVDLSFTILFISPESLAVEIYRDQDTLRFHGKVFKEEREIGMLEDIAGDKIVELGIPFKTIGAKPKDAVRFIISVEKEQNEIEKWPVQGYFLIATPYDNLENNFWRP